MYVCSEGNKNIESKLASKTKEENGYSPSPTPPLLLTWLVCVCGVWVASLKREKKERVTDTNTSSSIELSATTHPPSPLPWLLFLYITQRMVDWLLIVAYLTNWRDVDFTCFKTTNHWLTTDYCWLLFDFLLAFFLLLIADWFFSAALIAI